MKNLIKKISDATISEKEIQAIRKDFHTHLSSPIGTLKNYSGKYTQEVIKAIVKHRPDIINQQEIDSTENKKIHALFEKIYKMTMNNARVYIHPSTLRLLTDYLKGTESVETETRPFVSIFVESASGQYIYPKPKRKVDPEEYDRE